MAVPRLERKDPSSHGTAPTGGRPEDRESVRILQRMGPVSLGVSVPRSWVEAHRLRVGSPVQLRIVSDGSLRLRTPESTRPAARRVVIDVTPGMPQEHLFRRLLGAYLAGTAEFEVFQRSTISADTRAVVRTFVRRTIQPEVLSEETERMTLHDVSDSSPVPLIRLLSRMGQVVLGLQREAAESWVRLLAGSPGAWEARDDEVDRQAWFIERSAVRLLEGDPSFDPAAEGGIGPLGCWTVARSLERIADHAVKMGEAGSRLAESAVPRKQLVPLEQFHSHALRHLTSVLESLAEESGIRANELLDTGEALHETARTLSERLFPSTGSAATLPPSSAITLGRILESIDRTVAYAQDIAQVALDRALPTPRAIPAGFTPVAPRGATLFPATRNQTHQEPGGMRKK